MNSALLFPDAHENPKLESVGSAAAWYWACGLMFCRRRQEARAARGEPIDIIPTQNVFTLFADPKARDYVKALVKAKLWHEVDGGYRINDYEDTYRELVLQAGPAGNQPAPAYTQPAGDEPPQPTPSQLGGMARALTSRSPAGTFQPAPASSQLQPSRLAAVSPTPPSDPEDPQKQGKERDSREDQPGNKGSGAGARRRRAPATRLPEGFGLTAEHIEFGAKKGWPEWWMRNRCEQFCDLAGAKGWTYADWKLALYTFLRNEVGYGRGPQNLAHLKPGSGAQSGVGFRPRGPVQNNHGQTGFEAVTGGRK